MIRGACPGLHAPMSTGDGLLVRVKPPGGRLCANAATTLARAAARHGSGIIELTARANLQIRGLTPISAAHFAAAMVAAGLAHPDPATERRRNLLAPPLADADGLTEALEALLIDTPALDALPDKFLFAVDAGGVCPAPLIADITLRCDGAHHWIVIGDRQALCPPDTALAAVEALARRAGARRMRDVPASEQFGDLIPIPFAAPPTARLAGFLPDPAAFAIGLPFGQTDTPTLIALADLSRRYADGQLRLAPNRTIFLAPVAEAPTLAAAVIALDLIADAADPRLRIAACIGNPGCGSATVPTRSDAARLATIAFSGTIHVSGCAKGCAHGAADLTLVGRDGRYDLVRHGRAGEPPTLHGLTIEDVARQCA